MSKSKLEKQVKGKTGKLIEERTQQEMANKTKARTIIEHKWERKKYLQECDSDTIQNVIKIRLHMWQVNCNVPDQHKLVKESGKKSKIRKIKEKEKSREISRKGR